jgi:hypothetical protein
VCVVRNQRQLLGQRGGDRRRDPDRQRKVGYVRGVPCRGLERSGELLEIERVAAAVFIQGRYLGGLEPFAQEFACLSKAQRAQRDAGEARLEVRMLQRAGQRLRNLVWTRGQCDEDRRSRRAAQESAQQLHRRRIRPVEVIEHEDQGLACREPMEQLPHGPVAAIALVLACHPMSARERRQRRKHACELCSDVVVEGPKLCRLEAFDVLIQGIDEKGEGQVLLQLRRRSGQNQVPPQLSAGGELADQPRLADARLADYLEGTRAAPSEVFEDPLEQAQFVGTPDEVLGPQSHVSPQA